VCAADAQLVFENSLSNKTDTLAMSVRDNTPWIALPSFAEAAGYKWDWDRYAEKLVCTRDEFAITFVQDNLYCKTGSAIHTLSFQPQRRGAFLEISLDDALAVFGANGTDRYEKTGPNKIRLSPNSGVSLDSLYVLSSGDSTMFFLSLPDSISFSTKEQFPYFDFQSSSLSMGSGFTYTQGEGIIDSLQGLNVGGNGIIRLFLNDSYQDVSVHSRNLASGYQVSIVFTRHKEIIPDSVLFKNSRGQGISTIVIDAGHGGKDPGAVGPSGTKEKDVVLDVALEIAALLKDSTDLTVYLTREDDTFVKLRDRTKFANEKKADLFISIHANSIGGVNRQKRVKGYKIYFLSQAKNEADKMVAMKENAVVELEDNGEEMGFLQSIITEIVSNEYLKESEDFSILLEESFGANVANISRLHLGVGQAPFWVLNGAYMPAVLIEIGFISHPLEEKIITKKKNQKKIAHAIYQAVVAFKKKYEADL